jgi:type IV pilus assembly protein PilC
MAMRFSSSDLAAFYYKFGTMLQAGVPIRSALVSLQKSGPRSMRAAVAFLGERVERGDPVHEAIAEYPRRRFPNLDQHALAASGTSGALDVGLLSLAGYYENLARARRRLISASIFPAVILTAAVFIAHLPMFVLGVLGQREYGTVDYVRDTFGFLALLVLGSWLVLWLVRWALKNPRLAVRTDGFIRSLPLVGRVRFDYTLSQWISSIRLMLKAGFGVITALEFSSRSVDSPLLEHAYQQARPLIDSQMEVSRALEASGVFPDDVIQFWTTGEQSGRLDDMLDRLAKLYEERWRQSLEALSTWLPRIAYALVCVYIIFQMSNMIGSIVRTYSQALGQ